MQKLEKLLIDTRAASPIDRVGAQIDASGVGIRFYPLTVCEHCASEIALGAGFAWSEIGWYRGDYNRAEAYADSTRVAHHAHQECNSTK